MRDMAFTFVTADTYETPQMKRHLEEGAGQKCRFGYCWWYWFPRIRIRLHTSYKLIEFTWLRFSWSYEGTLR